MTRQATPDDLLGGPMSTGDAVAEVFGNRTITMLDPAVIRIDGGTQMRDGLNDATVTEYSEVMREVRGWGSFPACVVFYDGTEYWMADGFHRYAAFGRAGLKVMGLLMPAEVRSGTRRDAVLHAVAANANHGLRRTNADKRRSVLALLEDEEWSQWSDREIARRCAVSNRFVSDMRAELSSVNGSQIDERRVVRNGTEYTMHTANVGSAPAQPGEDLSWDLSPWLRDSGWRLYRQEGGQYRADHDTLGSIVMTDIVRLRMEMTRRSDTGASTTTWLTADEIVLLLDQWCEQFDEPDAALARLHDEASAGAGDMLDDWSNWVTGNWRLSRLLQALAALRLLPDEDEEHKPETKLWEPPDTAKWVKPDPKIQPVSSEIPVPLEPWTEERQIGDVTIWKADSRNLTGVTSVPPVDLVITSPPYNVGIEYSEHFDKLQQDQYIALLHNVFLGCHRVMKHGARIAVVVPFGIGRSPWQPMSLFVAAQIQAAGFLLRGQIIWDKGTTGNRTSWGSFRSPSDPSLRDTCECIIVAHKSQSQAAVPHLLKDEKGSYTAWLERSEYFMELAQDHWQVAPESAQRVGHPAPFPVELVRRLVHFYGWPGCTLLDPFAGSGTVGVAAVGLDCKAHLVDIDEAYCRLAERRIKAAYRGRNMLEETHAN